MSCGYCVDGFLIPGSGEMNINLKVTHNENGKNILKASMDNGWDIVEKGFPINHCPVCGTELVERPTKKTNKVKEEDKIVVIRPESSQGVKKGEVGTILYDMGVYKNEFRELEIEMEDGNVVYLYENYIEKYKEE